MKRRKFFNMAALGSTGLFLNKCFSSEGSKAQPVLAENIISNGKAMVVSTWKHGLAANIAAWNVLENGGTALDAVEAGVRITESDPTSQSVGYGGLPDREGNVTLDACIMNHKNECGAVACIQNIENPISVARKVMELTPHVMLVGKGAQEFAVRNGFEKKNLLTAEAKEAWTKWKGKNEVERPAINQENHDTIGMLALDEEGNLSGACTTSGWAYKMPGRVGDSPIIGAGLFVDNEVGAACATGMGEAVIRVAGSNVVVEMMRHGYSPQEACKLAVKRIQDKHEDLKNLQVGFLAMNTKGKVGAYSVYAGFDYAVKNQEYDQMFDAKYDLEW